MITANTAIELLIIEESFNEAEYYSSTLRNAGMAIHPVRADTKTDILEALGNHPSPDLILCSADGAAADLAARVELCHKKTPDSPLIILYRDQESEQLLEALRAGARDVVSKDDPEHLQLVVKREFADLLTRRELSRVLKQFHESEARCTALTGLSRDAIAYIHEGMHVQANPVYLEMFGYMDLVDIEGLPILDMIAPNDLEKFKRFLRSGDSEQGKLEIHCQDSNEKTFDALLEFSPASIDGEPCTQIIIRDTSSSRKLEEKLRQISSQDAQTGFANRQHFMQKLDETITGENQEGKPVSLLYISIDDFHRIRSETSLVASDTLLKEFAQVLEKSIQADQLLARFGDHSFTLLNNQTPEENRTYATQLRSAIKKRLSTKENTTVTPSCSIGIASFQAEFPNSQEFINNAYQACETARAEAGSGISVFDEREIQASFGETANETEMQELIKDALFHDRFKLVYQPIVSLQGESREYYAVLTRLIDHNGEEILPDHFMEEAMLSDQMADIDRWVIRNAVIELKRQREQGRKVEFFISLSAAVLKDRDFLLWVCDCLREFNTKGAWLTFQIMEPDLRSHLQEAKALIEGMKKIRCQILIGRYGISGKHEAVLAHLPIDYVRFDSTLVDDLAASQQQQDTLGKLNKQAQDQDIKTVVMGVEDANSLALLWTIGVNYIQGYFLQEPSENISYEFTGT